MAWTGTNLPFPFTKSKYGSWGSSVGAVSGLYFRAIMIWVKVYLHSFFTLWLLYHRGNIPRLPLSMRLGGSQSQSGYFVEEKISDSAKNRATVPRQAPSVIIVWSELLRIYRTTSYTNTFLKKGRRISSKKVAYLPTSTFTFTFYSNACLINRVVQNPTTLSTALPPFMEADGTQLPAAGP